MTNKEIQRLREFLQNSGKELGRCYFYIYPDKVGKLSEKGIINCVNSISFREITHTNQLVKFIGKQGGERFLRKCVQKITLTTYSQNIQLRNRWKEYWTF